MGSRACIIIDDNMHFVEKCYAAKTKMYLPSFNHL